MAKQKVVALPGDGKTLTHSPFAALGSLPVVAKPPLAQAPRLAPASPPPFSPSRVRLRLESRGTSGKVITRIESLPQENLEALAAALRRALGCGATLDGTDLILTGSLVERAGAWLNNVKDLRAVSENKPRCPTSAQSVQMHTPTPTHLSPMRRSDVRPGQRVAIVTKVDQASGALTEGIVRHLLTNAALHPRGIKVRLEGGQIGRVQVLYD